MAKANKKETRGRKTVVEEIAQALGKGATVPVGILPIPESLKEALQGKDSKAILKEATPFCAQYLLNCVVTRGFKPSWARIDIAKFIIQQVDGRPAQQLPDTGGKVNSLYALMVMAFEDARDPDLIPRNGGKRTPQIPQGAPTTALAVVDREEPEDSQDSTN